MYPTLTEFVARVFRYVENSEFIFCPHHLRILEALNERIWGRTTRSLIINQAPRSGKTSLVAYAIAYAVILSRGYHQSLVVGYATSLSNQTLNRVATILNAPGVLLSSGSCAKITRQPLNSLEINNGKGLIRAVSPTSAVTGYGAGSSTRLYPNIPASAIVGGAIWVDDLAQSSEAFSSTINERNKFFFDNSLSSRKNHKDTMTIIIAQRLSPEDIVEHCLKTGNYDLIKIPSLVNDKSFWPDKYPVEKLKHMQRFNPSLFENQYQQEGLVSGSLMMREEYIYSEDVIIHNSMDIIASIDASNFTGNDASVCVVAYFTRGNFETKKLYILDAITNSDDYVTFKQEMSRLINFHGVRYLLIENAASGNALAQDLKDKHSHIQIKTVNAKGQKAQRFAATCSYAAQKKIIFNKSLLKNCPHYMDELLKFTADGKAIYDDNVDATSQLVNHIFADVKGTLDKDWMGLWK